MLWRLVDVSPSSMLSSSRLLFLVSGSIKTVTKMPSTLTAAAIDLAARRPPALNRIGNKNTPMKPPSLPVAGDSMAGGTSCHRKEFGWINKCRRVRPEFCEEIADAVNDQKRIDENRRRHTRSFDNPEARKAAARSGPTIRPAACIANTNDTIMPRLFLPENSLISVALTG